MLPETTIFFECDLQQKLGPHMLKFDSVVHNACRLTAVSKDLDIPIVSTVHVQENFGGIDERIEALDHPGRTVLSKSNFTMMEPHVIDHMRSVGGGIEHDQRYNVVLYGCEAHVCVRQTAINLLERGYNVHLVLDGITSINHHDRNIGIKNMKQQGAYATTFQSLVFELLRDYHNPKFREVFKHIKNMPDEHFDMFHFEGRN